MRMCAKCAWAKNPNGRLLCQNCLTTGICFHHQFQFQFQKFISKTRCRIFPQVKKIIHDYRRISVLRKPKCADRCQSFCSGWLMVFLSRVVTASYSICPAITKDGWMPTLLQDHGCCFPSHTFVVVQNIQEKSFTYKKQISR